MSYAALIPFNEDGTQGEHIHFQNAWGGAVYIWMNMQHYLDWEGADWLLKWEHEGDEFWTLHERKDISDCDRICQAITYDAIYVLRKNGKRVADAMREFVKRHPSKGVVHLDAMADAMDKVFRDGAFAVGFYHNSVSENPWYDYREERERHYIEGWEISEVVPDLFSLETRRQDV